MIADAAVHPADMARAAPRGRSNAIVGGALLLAAIAGGSFPFWYTRSAGPIVRPPFLHRHCSRAAPIARVVPVLHESWVLHRASVSNGSESHDGCHVLPLQQHADQALSNNQIMRGPYVNTGSKDIGPDVPRK